MGQDRQQDAEDGEPNEARTSGHEDKGAAAVVRLDQIARKFDTYEDFLDNQVTEMDMFYLEDRSIARTIKELGFHGNSEKITREQFNEKKAELAVIKKTEEFKSGAKYLYTDRDAFLLELARREDANLSGRLVTVIYVRDRNSKGQEISSYIDYAQRLREDDFASIFAGRERLVSKTTDLSHYNWDTNVTHSNNSPNLDVIFHGHGGIQLKCKKDRRTLHMDPNRTIVDPNVEDTTRTVVRSRNYAQVVLFDHFIRFWANEDDAPQDEQKLPIGPDKDQSSGMNLNLYDNVTAAIYEDDLLDIARNALGGSLHQEQNGEWAPADILVEDDHGSAHAPPDNSQSNSLETSVLGTMKDLFDAHKDDVSFGTLGNFTFIQMIEQLGRLLPEKGRTKADQEALKIGQGTANIVVPVPDQDLPPVTVDVDELIETYETTPNKTYPETHFEDPTKLASNPLDSVTSGPQRHKGLEAPPGELFSHASEDVRKQFDPVPHIDRIKKLYPRSDSKVNPTPGLPASDEQASEPSSAGHGRPLKPILSTERVSGSRDHSDYFKQLETRMNQVFHGVAKLDSSTLPAYPKPITLR